MTSGHDETAGSKDPAGAAFVADACMPHRFRLARDWPLRGLVGRVMLSVNAGFCVSIPFELTCGGRCWKEGNERARLDIDPEQVVQDRGTGANTTKI